MRTKRSTALAVIAAMLALGWITITAEAQQDVVALLQSYEEAFNSGDIDAVMDFFAEDATLTVAGMATLKGKEQIRGWHEYEFALNGQVIPTADFRVEDGTIITGFATADDLTRALGVGALQGTSRFRFTDGLIQSKTIQLTATDMRKFGQAFSRLPQEVRQSFTYSAEYAQTVLDAARALPQRPHLSYLPMVLLLLGVAAVVAWLATT